MNLAIQKISIRIWNKSWEVEVEIDLYQRANMIIGKIASSKEYRMDEQFRNCEFSEPNFDFPSWEKSRNFLIFLFAQFQKFQIWKIWKFFNMENSKNLQFSQFKKIPIWKIWKIFDLEISKNN